ncbi:acyl-CoA dehydrogenase family protein [Halobacteriales archaeon Cl-PHB]
MPVSLTSEQRMLVDMVEELAEEEFADDAFDWEGSVPWENVELLAEQGIMGVNFDEKYGGEGMTDLDAMLVVEALGRVCPDTCWYVGDQLFLAPHAVHEFGTEAAKEKYVTPVIEGEERMAICMSEPEAGSDLHSMTTTVEEAGDDFVLNGEKIWVSNVPQCSSGVVWAKFPEGIGAVVMDFDEAGVEISQNFTNMIGHHQTQFYMEDVHVPEENLLVRGEDGLKRLLTALNWERMTSATMSNAFARCALEKALDYAQQRVQFDQPIADFQGIEWRLAEMLKEVEASRALTYQAAERAVERGTPPDPVESNLAKWYSAEMVEEVVSEALQIHGANGYQQGHPLEYLYRFARGQRIAAGTDATQKNTVARMLKRNGIPGYE